MKIPPQNKEGLYAQFSEYEIFSFYLGEFSLGKPINSPYREDNNPSFNVFKTSRGEDKYLYKDFATGDCGSCIHLVQKLYNLSYYQAIRRIWDDLNNYPNKVSANKEAATVKSEPSLFSFNELPWNNKTLKYWEKYGISQELLKFYNVSPITTFCINNSMLHLWSDSEPMYKYSFLYENKIYYKIYRPYSDKKCKWYFNGNYNIIEGLEQLLVTKKRDLLIITKSLKDVIVLKSLGFKAVAPPSENTRFSNEQIPSLFKDCVILFDNDSAGIKGAKKLKLPYRRIFLPKENKDVSDYLLNNGKDATINILKKLINESPF